MKDHTKDNELSEEQAEKIRGMIEKILEDSFQKLDEIMEQHQKEIEENTIKIANEILDAEKEKARRIEKAKSENPTAFYVATVQTMEVVSMSLYLQYRVTGDVPQGELKEFRTLAEEAEQLREKADPYTVKKFKELEKESERRVSEIE